MNRYDRKRITQNKLKKKCRDYVYFVEEKTDDDGKAYYQRFYMSGVRKLAKRETNRRLRKSKNDYKLRGCAYRRKFDYWNTLF